MSVAGGAQDDLPCCEVDPVPDEIALSRCGRSGERQGGNDNYAYDGPYLHPTARRTRLLDPSHLHAILPRAPLAVATERSLRRTARQHTWENCQQPFG